jgi:hypothetical protein
MARTVEHTPEPWRVGEMCGGCINVEFDGSPGHPRRTVARAHVVDEPAEAEGNARLIAAAPELKRIGAELLRTAQAGQEGESIVDSAFMLALEELLARIEGRS